MLGDDPAALLTGALAAKLGLSVLMVPLGHSQKLSISESGQPLDPEPNFLAGLGKTESNPGLLRFCLNHLGALPSELDQIQDQRQSLQILAPGFRLRMDDLRGELPRAIGKARSQKLGIADAVDQSEAVFLGFWLKLIDRLTVKTGKDRKRGPLPTSHRQLYKMLAKQASHSATRRHWLSAGAALDDDMELIGSALWYAATTNPNDKPAMPDLLHLAALGRAGAGFRGGISAFRQLPLRLATRLGAEYDEEGDCRRIFIENGRFKGVQIGHRGEMVEAGGAVIGCSLSEAREKISVSGKKWQTRVARAPAPTGWRFAIGLSLRPEGLPEGISRRLIWKEPGAPILEIEVAEATKEALRFIFLRTVLPFNQDSLRLDYQQMIAARMFRKFHELFPFSEAHVTRIFPDFGKAGNEESFSRLYGFTEPGLIPGNLRCYGDHRGLGSRSGIEGLLVVSPESFPQLGSQGSLIAALEATAWLAHRNGLPGPIGHNDQRLIQGSRVSGDS